MNAAALLIIFLSHEGYWIGGSANEISVEWAASAPMPAADLHWELMFGTVNIASGQTPVAWQGGKAVVRITSPQVRVRTALRWQYTVLAGGGGKELDRGHLPIVIFPRNLMEGLAHRIGSSRVAVWDEKGELVKALNDAKAPFHRYTDVSKLGFEQADAILVGADTLDLLPFDQSPLFSLARAGASVMIFRQSRCQELGTYPVVRRTAPASFEWMADHPMLRGMDANLLKSLTARFTEFLAVRLPPDEAALAIAAWPREVPSASPAAVDALLASKSIGKGRVVFCQIQFGDWQDDSRSQIFLMNAIDYLLSPAAPTPRPSDRPATRPVEARPLPAIAIPPGDHP